MTLSRHSKLAITLLTTLTLAACSANVTNQTAPAAPSVAKTASNSQNTTKTSDTETETTTDQTATSSTETTTTSETPQQASLLDLTALSNGDFSSLVGTWSNAQGQFTVDAQGNVTAQFAGVTTEGYSIKVSSLENNILFAGLVHQDGHSLGSFHIIPAGVPTPSLGIVYQEDSISSGQSVNAEETPFFKQVQ